MIILVLIYFRGNFIFFYLCMSRQKIFIYKNRDIIYCSSSLYACNKKSIISCLIKYPVSEKLRSTKCYIR